MAPGESRYRILRTISDQGATEILEAVALGAGSFERRVVMKRARPEARSEDPEFVERFLDEARIASQLHHANVVSVLDFGVGEGGEQRERVGVFPAQPVAVHNIRDHDHRGVIGLAADKPPDVRSAQQRGGPGAVSLPFASDPLGG